MKYFLSVGEASGDIHAAALIDALRQADSAAEFVYLGGDLMHQSSGVAPLIHYREMAYMGFSGGGFLRSGVCPVILTSKTVSVRQTQTWCQGQCMVTEWTLGQTIQ